MNINKEKNMTKDIKTTTDLPTSSINPTSKRFGEQTFREEIGKEEMRINQLEARLDAMQSYIDLLMRDREASIRLLHGRMNNEAGIQTLLHGWKDA
jgi:hypothetical protein